MAWENSLRDTSLDPVIGSYKWLDANGDEKAPAAIKTRGGWAGNVPSISAGTSAKTSGYPTGSG